jgi:hypothetical protein
VREGLSVMLSFHGASPERRAVMKSNKQRRVEIKARRSKQTEKRKLAAIEPSPWLMHDRLPVNLARFARGPNFANRDFVVRGYYAPVPFTCEDCGIAQVWTAAQQKWWYESVGASLYTTARRCRPCRARAREEKRIAAEKKKQGSTKHENNKPNR